jgi:hypothetical protein
MRRRAQIAFAREIADRGPCLMSCRQQLNQATAFRLERRNYPVSTQTITSPTPAQLWTEPASRVHGHVRKGERDTMIVYADPFAPLISVTCKRCTGFANGWSGSAQASSTRFAPFCWSAELRCAWDCAFCAPGHVAPHTGYSRPLDYHMKRDV